MRKGTATALFGSGSSGLGSYVVTGCRQLCSYIVNSLGMAMSRSQLKVKPVAEMIMRPFSFGQEQVEAHG
jgi:hypothetical protein